MPGVPRSDAPRAEPAREPPAGVEIVSLAERPDLVEAAYEVHAETLRDVPVGPEAPTAAPVREWRAETLDGPAALPDLSLVAISTARSSAGQASRRSPASRASPMNLLTGVRREARGRGIATALKREQAWRAKERRVLVGSRP